MQVLLVRPRRGRRRARHDLAHRLHRRGRLRDVRAAGAWRRACGTRCSGRQGRRRSSRAASARATRCASKPRCASTATTSTTPPRVLEADLGWIVGWKKDEFIGHDALRAQKADGVRASSSASRWSIAPSPATATRCCSDGAAGRHGHERHADAVPEEGHRHGVRAAGAWPAPAPSSTSTSAAGAPRPSSCRLPFYKRARRDGVAGRCHVSSRPEIHERPRVGAPRRRHRRRRHHRLRPAAARRRRLRRAARGRPDAHAGPGVRHHRIGEGGVRALRAGQRRGHRGQHRRSRTSPRTSTRSRTRPG